VKKRRFLLATGGILIAVLLLAAIAVFGFGSGSLASRGSSIEFGMTPEKVGEVLGRPYSIALYGADLKVSEILLFDEKWRGGNKNVRFDRVFGAEEPKPSEGFAQQTWEYGEESEVSLTVCVVLYRLAPDGAFRVTLVAMREENIPVAWFSAKMPAIAKMLRIDRFAKIRTTRRKPEEAEE